MIKFGKKYWAILVFALSFFLDSQYGILEKLITDVFWLNIAKGLGALLLAYMTGKKGVSKDEGDNSIGGGGIKNPKP